MNSVATKRGSNRHVKHNKRLRKYAKITPWKDEWELEAVGRALISVAHSDTSEINNGMPIEQAFEMVKVWKARTHILEGLPHSIESTFSLARLYWIDNVQPNSTLSVTELRLAYSSAIVRSINGFADKLQQQRFVAASVSTLCEQLGMPTWLVDIRHEASHNALPTLSVLRLATTTLLEFLKNEFWIPSCHNWKQENDKQPQKKEAIEYLLEYKAYVTTFFSSTVESTTTAKKKSTKPVISILPIDPLFGDDDGSSDDDDWEDPIMGSVGGSSIGTNVNRFAILESTSKKDAKKRKSKQMQKKKSNQKYPSDFAKDFVTAVSPEEGLASSIMFLVWGGIGGAPSGRGVLIPGSTVAFPATAEGIAKSWQRYSPLLQVLGRVWPGFCAALFIHLVDFVLSIEEAVVKNEMLDPGSARKLYFLSAWIRFMLSKQYIASVDPECSSKAGNKKNDSIELTLAESSHLEKLGYPLNSICDRCNQFQDMPDFRKTSHDLVESIEVILGEHRCPNFGISEIDLQVASNPLVIQTPSIPKKQENSFGMSLDDMEAMLSDEDEAIERNKHRKEEEEHPSRVQDELTTSSKPRSAWVRCTRWDPCSIGSLPGYPI